MKKKKKRKEKEDKSKEKKNNNQIGKKPSQIPQQRPKRPYFLKLHQPQTHM
jgi:hypothetical protein